MSFHFCSHAWEVRDVEDGTLVKLTHRDLDAASMADLIEDLFGLVQESGRPNLYLDFASLRQLASVAIAKFIALNARLRTHGGRLALINVAADLRDTLEAVALTDVLDIRAQEAAETIV
jgi:anti-anti-sigma factor